MSSSNEQNRYNQEDPAPAPAVAAAINSATKGDATIAQMLDAMQQLISIFQFTPAQARDAVDAVGPDVTLAYNFILDNGGEDKGGAIVPKRDCPHLTTHLIWDVKNFHFGDNARCGHKETACSKKGKGKGDFMDDGGCPSTENWLCLSCGVLRCSRYTNGHCQDHHEITKASNEDGVGHCVHVSLGDLSVWCFECNAYLEHSSLTPILKTLEAQKFGADCSAK